MKNKEDITHEPDLQEIAGGIAAASMVDKLRSLQGIASKHGFNFLVYMLDIARAEAESLRKDNPESNGEKSNTSS